MAIAHDLLLCGASGLCIMSIPHVDSECVCTT